MNKSCCSSGVEHVLGKDETISQNPIKYEVSLEDCCQRVPSSSPNVPIDSGATRVNEPKLLCTVYRHFDVYDDLLYVGISKSVMERTGSHELYSHWFDQVVTIKVTHYPTRALAMAAEALAIAEENPKYNIAGANESVRKDAKSVKMRAKKLAKAATEWDKLKRSYEREEKRRKLVGEEEILRLIMGDAAYEAKYRRNTGKKQSPPPHG